MRNRPGTIIFACILALLVLFGVLVAAIFCSRRHSRNLQVHIQSFREPRSQQPAQIKTSQWNAPTRAQSPAGSVQFVVKELSAPGGRYSVATGINNLGHISGAAQTSPGKWHACLWIDGRVRDLGTLGGKSSRACALNNHDEVVGAAQTPDGKWHAFLWSRGQMQNIDPHECDTAGVKINDLGQVLIGASPSPGSPPSDEPVTPWEIWEHGRHISLLRLLRHPRGRLDSIFLNDRGEIAGNLASSQESILHGAPFIWSRGRLRWIDTHDWYPCWVEAINDNGIPVVTHSTGDGRWMESFAMHGREAVDLIPGGVTAFNNCGVALGTIGGAEQDECLFSHGKWKMLDRLPTEGRFKLVNPAGMNDRGQIIFNPYGGDGALLLTAYDWKTGRPVSVTYNDNEFPLPIPRREDPHTWRSHPLKDSSDGGADFSPDSRLLATGGTGGSILIWRVEGRKLLHQLPFGKDDGYYSLQFSPDGKMLMAGKSSGEGKVWDTRTWRELYALNTGDCAAFTSDGKYLVEMDTQGLSFYDATTGGFRRRIDGITEGSGLAFSPNGQTLAAGSNVWNWRTGKLLHTFHTEDQIRSVAFSPDGHLALGGSGEVQIWDISAWRMIDSLEASHGAPLQFSPDGQLLVCGCAWENSVMWDFRTKTVAEFPSGNAGGFAFSPDGRWLVTDSDDRDCDRNRLDLFQVPQESAALRH